MPPARCSTSRPQGTIVSSTTTSSQLPVDARAKALAASGTGSYFSDAHVSGVHLRVLDGGARPARRGADRAPADRGRPRAPAAAARAARRRRRRHPRGGRARRRRGTRGAGSGLALHAPHRGADGQSRPLAATRDRGTGRARAAGAQLQRDARCARALGRGAAPPRGRRQPRAAHPDRQPARQHPGARRTPTCCPRRIARACAPTSSRSSTSSPRSWATSWSSRAARSRATSWTTCASTRSCARSSSAPSAAPATASSSAATLQPTVVSGEPERISRAISNLIGNAHKWSPPGGLIEIDLADGTLSIRDHGAGLRRGRPPARLRPLLPRRQRARDARLGSRAGHRATGGRGARRLGDRRQRAGWRSASSRSPSARRSSSATTRARTTQAPSSVALLEQQREPRA